MILNTSAWFSRLTQTERKSIIMVLFGFLDNAKKLPKETYDLYYAFVKALDEEYHALKQGKKLMFPIHKDLLIKDGRTSSCLFSASIKCVAEEFSEKNRGSLYTPEEWNEKFLEYLNNKE